MTSQILPRAVKASIPAILSAAFLISQPSTTSAQVRAELAGGVLAGLPSGDFADNVSATGWGFSLTAGIQLPQSPVFLGAEFGYLIYGHERRSEIFNQDIPDVRVDVVTNNNILLGYFFLRLQPQAGKVRPYVDGLLGFKYLYTETGVRDASDWIAERVADYVNFDDWAFSYGVGAGAAFALWERASDIREEGKPVSGVYLDLGVRYLPGAEAEYLKEGSIQRAGGVATFVPERSKTDMLHPHLRVRVLF